MPGKRITSNQKSQVISLYNQGYGIQIIVDRTNVSERSAVRILEAMGYDLQRKKRVRTPKVPPASQSGIVNPSKSEQLEEVAVVMGLPVLDVKVPELKPEDIEGAPVFTPATEELPLFKLEQHEQPQTFPGTAPIYEGWAQPERKPTLWERLKAYFGR